MKYFQPAAAPRLHRCLTVLPAAVVLVAGLAACGSDDATSATSTARTSVTTAAPTETTAPLASTATSDGSASESYPITIQHAYGETIVAQAPARVVALGVEDADIALALGVTPIAVPENRPLPIMPWTQAAIDANPRPDGAEVEVLSWGSALPFEQIAALEPDLILGVMAGIDEASYALLSDIAPTLVHTTELWSDPWQAQTREIGAALDRGAAAEDLIVGTEAALADSAAAHPDFAGLTYSIALIGESGTFGLFNDPDAVTSQILAEYGMVPNPLIDALGDTDQGQISLEQADLLDSDVTLIYWFDPQLEDDFLSDPLFAQLDVVARGAVISVGDDVWRALRSPSVLSMPWVVGELSAQIEATLD